MAGSIDIRRLSDGAFVYQQGDEADGMFVVLEGKVRVFRRSDGHETTLAILSTGNSFGEGALFDRRRRSGTAEWLGEAVGRFVGAREFRETIPDPHARRIFATLSERLRATDELAARLAAENEARHEWIEHRSVHREWVL